MPTRLNACWMLARTRQAVVAMGAGMAGVALTLAPPSIKSAEAERLKDRGSQEDQAACSPDVFRLCALLIPNEPRILACLINAKDQLSPACRAVFERDEAPKAAGKPPPRRTAKPAKPQKAKPPSQSTVRRGKGEG